MLVGSMSMLEEESARRYTEYQARNDGHSERDRGHHLGLLNRANCPFDNRNGFRIILEFSLPLPRDILRQ